MKLVTKLLRMPVGRASVALIAFTYTTAAVAIPRATAQQQALPADYRVGPGDSVFLSVPQRPDLNRELVVDAKGEVNLPLIGKVLVRGMTDNELEGRLLQSLREYYPSVNRVEVNITRASSNVIWVSGDVKLPGKYSFSQPANVWEAIREAGGPNPTASLDAVRIIKDRSRGGSTTVVDVTAAMEGGSVDKLPMLDPGDTIIVTAKQETYTGSNGVNVMGGVLTPGVYPMQGRQDLMTAILQAGGPNDRAQLDNIRIVRPHANGPAETMKINLNNYLNKGDVASNPLLRPGDTVAVGRKGFTSQELVTILTVVTTLATLTLLFFTIRDELDQNTVQIQ